MIQVFFMSHKDPKILQSVFNNRLDIVSDWLYMNKLSVNAKKTNFMMFTNRNVDIEQFHIKLAGSEIKHVPSLKFLGITIDNKLTWKNHLDIICNKLSRNVGVLYRIKMLPTNILRMIYNAIIAPFLDYGISIWGSAANIYLDRLFKLQKRAIRIVNHSPYLAHTSSIFYSLKLLNIYDIYISTILVYSCFYVIENCYLRPLLKYYSLNCNIHSHATRNAANFHIPKTRKKISYKSIAYQGPVVWNSIPSEIRNSKTLKLFKCKYKKHLQVKYYSK